MMDLKICLFINEHLARWSSKKDKGTEYAIGWISKRVYNSQLTELHSAFLPSIKCFRKKKEYSLTELL